MTLRKRLTLCLVVGTLPPSALACSVDDKVTTYDDDVTSVENTSVKSQAVGNCWLYTTAAWVESLHKGASGKDIDVSEAYWTYWDWYEKITGGNLAPLSSFHSRRLTVVEGGYWGTAVDLIERYGWMHEVDFVAGSDANAARHEGARSAINAALASELRSPEARRDPARVRAALDAAWKLEPRVVEDLRRRFPVSAPPVSITGRVGEASLPGTHIHAPNELRVLSANDGKTVVTLADAIGRQVAKSKLEAGAREGTEAWSSIEYPAGGNRRAFLRKVQVTLNRRLAVPIAWYVGVAVDGAYRGSNQPMFQWGTPHMSLIVDYEVERVPGFGTLRVGQRETRPEALAATLDADAKVTFFRVKNSWGVGKAVTAEEALQLGVAPDDPAAVKSSYLPSMPGYNDLYLDYLDKEMAWHTPFAMSVVLPARLVRE